MGRLISSSSVGLNVVGKGVGIEVVMLDKLVMVVQLLLTLMVPFRGLNVGDVIGFHS
jgi:hypothetical protein